MKLNLALSAILTIGIGSPNVSVVSLKSSRPTSRKGKQNAEYNLEAEMDFSFWDNTRYRFSHCRWRPQRQETPHVSIAN
jgi:hypothetical protein